VISVIVNDGCDGVQTDTAFAPVERERPDEVRDRRLGRVVRRLPPVAAVTRHRGDGHEGAADVGQPRQGRLGQVEEPVDVGAAQARPDLVVQFGQGPVRVAGGVADHHVDPPEAGHHVVDQGPDLRAVGEVGRQGRRPLAREPGESLLQALPPPARDRDGGTRVEECVRDRRPIPVPPPVTRTTESVKS
jgi:hypothetical protein